MIHTARTLAMLALAGLAACCPCSKKAAEPRTAATGRGFAFPHVSPDHKHMNLLLKNAIRYIDPLNELSDPHSGYLYEGWNHDSKTGFHLRSFTQLTSIGEGLELLANIAAGQADNPYLSRSEALEQMALVVKSLRHDQKDPGVGAKGLLANFLGLTPEGRLGPLTNTVTRKEFTEVFGEEKGALIWKALAEKKWLKLIKDGNLAFAERKAGFGPNRFTGPLAPFSDEATKDAIMRIFGNRIVMIVFGDNANLSASVGKAIGALLSPGIKADPKARALRDELEAFLNAQQGGYEFLVDPKTGTFYFGWNATNDEWYGWGLGDKWTVGHNNYFINEFRGPSMFVHLRFGTPVSTLRNTGFKIKRYTPVIGEDLYSLASWDGSAFQVLGISLFMGELMNPGWKTLLSNTVDIEIDFSTRRKLPGFLSESYTGNKRQYTGEVGIPDIAASSSHRITDAPSLYTLGVAYMIAPDKVEHFLADNWYRISTLLTPHGPWEGYNRTRDKIIAFQTSAHTLSLVLGAIGTAQDNMMRYLEHKGLMKGLEELYVPGEAFDFLSQDTELISWTAYGKPIEAANRDGVVTAAGTELKEGGLIFGVSGEKSANLSSGKLILRYRSNTEVGPVVLEFARGKDDPAAMDNEVYTHLENTAGTEATIEIPLPATPGLNAVKELKLSFRNSEQFNLDLTLTGLSFQPNRGAWIGKKP